MLLLYLTCWAVSRCDKKYELTLNILNWVSRTLLPAQLIDYMTSCCTILEKLGSYLQTKNCPELLAGIISPHEFYSYQSTALFIGLCLFCLLITRQNPPSLYCCVSHVKYNDVLDYFLRLFALQALEESALPALSSHVTLDYVLSEANRDVILT